MSYTEIYQVKQNGDVEIYHEIHNSHRGASLVWQEMAIRYLPECPDARSYFMNHFRSEAGMRKVWDLASDERVPMAHRIVMASTLDHVIVKREDIQAVIDAMRQFAKDFTDPGHIPAEADILEKMLADAETWGVCWNQTSVSGGVWERQGKEEDTYRPYNINLDTGHWFMFQEKQLAEE